MSADKRVDLPVVRANRGLVENVVHDPTDQRVARIPNQKEFLVEGLKTCDVRRSVEADEHLGEDVACMAGSGLEGARLEQAPRISGQGLLDLEKQGGSPCLPEPCDDRLHS